MKYQSINVKTKMLERLEHTNVLCPEFTSNGDAIEKGILYQASQATLNVGREVKQPTVQMVEKRGSLQR